MNDDTVLPPFKVNFEVSLSEPLPTGKTFMSLSPSQYTIDCTSETKPLSPAFFHTGGGNFKIRAKPSIVPGYTKIKLTFTLKAEDYEFSSPGFNAGGASGSGLEFGVVEILPRNADGFSEVTVTVDIGDDSIGFYQYSLNFTRHEEAIDPLHPRPVRIWIIDPSADVDTTTDS